MPTKGQNVGDVGPEMMGVMHWLPRCEKVPDQLVRHGAVRDAHLSHLAPYFAKGQVVRGVVFVDSAA